MFNVYALDRIGNEDELTAYFEGVALLSNVVILVYHGVFAGAVLKRFGIDLAVLAIPFLIAAVWLLTWFYPTLLTMALAQGLIYFFIDYLAVARLHIPLTFFAKALRGRVKAVTEGFGRACGFILLFGIAGCYAFRPEFEELGRIILLASFIFLGFPFLFRPVYFRHVLKSLRSSDRNLARNANQALGKRRIDSVVIVNAYAPPAPPFEIPGKQSSLVATRKGRWRYSFVFYRKHFLLILNFLQFLFHSLIKHNFPRSTAALLPAAFRGHAKIVFKEVGR